MRRKSFRALTVGDGAAWRRLARLARRKPRVGGAYLADLLQARGPATRPTAPDARDAPSRPPPRLEVPLEPPPAFAAALLAERRAAEYFARLTPAKRRRYLGWITMAKRADTRARRIAEAVVLLAQHRELGLK